MKRGPDERIIRYVYLVNLAKLPLNLTVYEVSDLALGIRPVEEIDLQLNVSAQHFPGLYHPEVREECRFSMADSAQDDNRFFWAVCEYERGEPADFYRLAANPFIGAQFPFKKLFCRCDAGRACLRLNVALSQEFRFLFFIAGFIPDNSEHRPSSLAI